MTKKVPAFALTGLLALSLFSSFLAVELLVFAPQSAEAAPPAITSFLQSGSSGTQVTLLQQALYRLGYLTAAPTGTYGPMTTASVKKFQVLNGLPQTGSLDTHTMYLINLIIARFGAGALSSTPRASVPTNTYIPSKSPITSTVAVSTPASNSLTIGSTGAHVILLQQMLIAQKLLSSEATGYYGALTKAAVLAYQSMHSLPATGVADPQTQSSIATTASKVIADNTPIPLPSVPVIKPTTPTIPPITEPAPPAPPTPSVPVPNPARKPVVVAEGDSISIFWAGNYTGIYAAAHPGIQFYGTAVGGSGIAASQAGYSLTGRLAADASLKPNYVTVFIGANDMSSDPATIQQWINSLWAYIADIKKATGAKVAVATVLGHCIPNTATWNFESYNKGFNQQRIVANNAIRAAAGNQIDAVIDFAADPTIGTDAAACNTAILPDGTHPSDIGQQKMATIYTAALDALIANTTVPTAGNPSPIPPTQTPTQSGNNPGPISSNPVLQAILDAVQVPTIASNFNRADQLVPAWGTGELPPADAQHDVGAFRLICNASHEAFDDPIVYPGQPGKSHLHEFFGNTLTNANSTYATLRTSGDSTCDGPLNRSAYWVPALLDANDKVIRPDYISIYYKELPETSPGCLQAGKGCVPLPRGLKMLAGYNMGTGTLNPPGAMWFNCTADAPGASGHFATLVDAAINCPPGKDKNGNVDEIEAVVAFPNCWDGKNLDSADHRSHLGYMDYRKGDGKAYCPDNIPYIIPQFSIGVFYAVNSTLDRSGTWDPSVKTWHYASDNTPGMAVKTPGTTFHSDWFGAWDDLTMKTWWDNCINRDLNCSGGVLGDGKQLKQYSGFTWSASPQLVDQPSKPVVAMNTPAPLIPSPSIAIGVKTPEVTAIQQILKTAGFFKHAVTGYFGSVTQAALAAYNKSTQIAGVAAASMPGMR